MTLPSEPGAGHEAPSRQIEPLDQDDKPEASGHEPRRGF